jgi:hypothetical protein
MKRSLLIVASILFLAPIHVQPRVLAAETSPAESGPAGAGTTANERVEKIGAKIGDTPLAAPREPSIEIAVVSAASGKPIGQFRVIVGVPSGVYADRDFIHRTGIDPRDVANWQAHTLRVGTNGRLEWPIGRTYPEMSLRVEAEGYQTQRSAWIKEDAEPARLEFRLIQDWGVWGCALLPDGKPAANAIVALALPQRNIAIREGQIRGANQPPPRNESERWRLPILVDADVDGRFRLPFESDPASVVLIMHDAGVREMPYLAFQQQPEIKLEPWGRIEGQVLWKDEPGADLEVDLLIFRSQYGYPGMIECYADTRTDKDGRFVFEKVLPGSVQLSSHIKLPGGGSAVLPGLSVHVRVQPGGATNALLGGQGRTVRGRLTGRDSWDGVSMHFHPTAPHIGFPGDDEMWQAFGMFRHSPIGPIFFRDGLKPNADGSFAIAHVLPGSYQLFVTAPGVDNYAGSTSFDVDNERAGRRPPPLDLGEIKVRPADASR